MALSIPPKKNRYFVTRSCRLNVIDAQTKLPSEFHLFGMSYHAHLLGREMYTEVTFANGATSFDLGSDTIWHFDDQYLRNLLPLNLSVRSGDHVQTTCVFDSTSRAKPTRMGLETTDEMCWGTFKGWPSSTTVTCDGEIWTGELQKDEAGMGLAQRHPQSAAELILDGSFLGSGGNIIKDARGQSYLSGYCANNPAVPAGICQVMPNLVHSTESCEQEIDTERLPNPERLPVGPSPLSLCCSELCASKCSEHPTCAELTSPTTTAAGTTKVMTTDSPGDAVAGTTKVMTTDSPADAVSSGHVVSFPSTIFFVSVVNQMLGCSM